jgi:hypothetical protein
MATKKQKREAGIQKQAEALARVTAGRLAAQQKDQERRAEREAQISDEVRAKNLQFEATLARAATPQADAIVRKMQIARSVSERPWNAEG